MALCEQCPVGPVGPNSMPPPGSRARRLWLFPCVGDVHLSAALGAAAVGVLVCRTDPAQLPGRPCLVALLWAHWWGWQTPWCYWARGRFQDCAHQPWCQPPDRDHRNDCSQHPSPQGPAAACFWESLGPADGPAQAPLAGVQTVRVRAQPLGAEAVSVNLAASSLFCTPRR